MSSDNTGSCAVTCDWFGWVSVPGQGRAWVSGHVSVPACTPRSEIYRLIGAWLRERGCAAPADLSRAITLLPATDTPKGV